MTAEIGTPAGPLAVVSVHVYSGDEQHADLKRLVELLVSTFARRPALTGGEFKSERRFDEVYAGKKHRTFSTLCRAGLHEVHWGAHAR